MVSSWRGVWMALFCLQVRTVTSRVFPSIIWSPYNPLFSCKEPTLYVNINDDVSFICPYYDAGFVQPPEGLEKPIYENMYFLGENETAFQQCDASIPNARSLLLCDKYPIATYKNRFKLQFYDTKLLPETLTFKEGADYYLIGTGFRTQANVFNVTGGSCNTTEKDVAGNLTQYHLKLKIHVCRQEDKNCGVCESNNCYSKDCHCSLWTQTDPVVSKDFTSVSINYQRTCTRPNQPALTETKLTASVTLSGCSEWTRSAEAKPDPSCIYLNRKSELNNNCSSVHVRKCAWNLTATTRSFCQYRIDSDCHCSEWKRKPSTVIGDGLYNNYQRACGSKTENKRVRNGTLSSCSSFFDNNMESIGSCIFVDDSQKGQSNFSCSITQIKQCSTDSGQVNVCRNLRRACPECSPWAEISSPPSYNSNLTVKTQFYHRLCPNGTVLNKTVTTQCSPPSLNCSQWVRVEGMNSQRCVHFLNMKPTSSDCYEIHKQVCDSFDDNCRFQELSVCKYVVDDVNCLSCNEWLVEEKTSIGKPSKNFSSVNRTLTQTRECASGEEKSTETRAVQVCLLKCDKWSLYNGTKHAGCEMISGSEAKYCGLNHRTCKSEDCDNLSINYCVERTCPTSVTTTPISATTNPTFSTQIPEGKTAQVSSLRNDDDNTFVYIAIPLFLVCFLLGAFIGFMAFKRYHKKSCLNQVSSHKFIENKGATNLAYQSSVIEKRPTPQSVYYADGSVHCDPLDQSNSSN